MSDDLRILADRVLSQARKAGADDADVLIGSSTSVSVDVRQGQLEQAERSESTEIGLRVFLGKRQANVAISDTSESAISAMAERAVAMAGFAPEDPYCGLANVDDLSEVRDAQALDLVDKDPDPAPSDLESAAREAEAAALAVKGISQVQSASAGFGGSKLVLAASNGFVGEFERTSSSVSCVAISGEGTSMEREHAGEGRVYRCDLPTPREIGALAAERAVSRKGARKPPTGAFPVIYDERISGGLIGHLLSAASGASIARGSSWLLEALGEQVLPETLSIFENPHRQRIGGSRPFDAEGLPTAERNIVKDGILQGWTLDLASSRKLGLSPTGNAARSPGSNPSPSVSNIEITQGSQSKDEMLREMGTGLLVTSMIGTSINANTGDYSRGASGYWVVNGEISYPVNECTLAGNLRDMLMTITPANDARSHLSRVIPSLRVEGLTIAGA